MIVSVCMLCSYYFVTAAIKRIGGDCFEYIVLNGSVIRFLQKILLLIAKNTRGNGLKNNTRGR